MSRRLPTWIVEWLLLLGLGLTASAAALATVHEAAAVWGTAARPRPGDDARPSGAMEPVWLPEGRVTIVVHGVTDDGKTWAPRFKKALTQSPYGDSRQQVYLFRWTGPDRRPPALCHARTSVAGLDARYPDDPQAEAGYQVREARRLRDFLAGARALYREYGVDGRVDVVAHSQGTLLTVKALELGSDADNVVFLGSPLRYTGERQDDVIAALPHVRGVLFNYYTRNDLAMRFMGGGLLYEPRAWPEAGLPRDKVVQVCVDVPGHTGYYTEEAIRANYVDKLGMRGGGGSLMSAATVREFAGKWQALTAAARLIDPDEPTE
jgi:hypothetical protein